MADFTRHNRQQFPAHQYQENHATIAALLQELHANSDREFGQVLTRALHESLLHALVCVPMMDFKMQTIVLIESTQGGLGLPVFTQAEELRQWQEVDMVRVPLPVACAYAMQAGAEYLLLNIANRCSGLINYVEMTYFAEGRVPPSKILPHPLSTGSPNTLPAEQANNNLQLKPLPLQELPEVLCERLVGYFSRQPVQAAYFFGSSLSEEPMNPTLAVRLPEQALDRWEHELWPDLRCILQEVMEPRSYLNIFLLNQTPMLDEVLSEMCEPFYSTTAAQAP